MSLEEQEEYDDQNEEFQKIYSIVQEQGRFGKRQRDPPLYVWFDNLTEKDVAVAAFGHKCLNYADDRHILRDCPADFLNRSKLLNPEMGKGTSDEVDARWRRWKSRMTAWRRDRVDARTSGGRSRG